MGFDLSEMLKSVSESDTGREQIEYIPLDLLDSDEQNFYELSEVPALADNIATVGLQQPLRVRKHPTAEGKYMIVSGHRRRAALELLAKDEPDRWAEVPCIVQRDTVSPALQQLQLIYANSGTRKLSSHDMNEQAAQVEKLLYQLQEEGHEFPGRMRDHVAKVMQTTNTKLATLKKIREHLAECWQPHYKNGTVKESAAYELSKLTPADQKLIYDVLHQLKRDLRYEYADDFKTYSTRMDDACNGECASCSKEARDIAIYRKRCKAVSAPRYSNFHCDLCCSACDDLGACKYACPAFSDKIKAIKAAKKEDAQRLKAEQEELERPTVELLKLLWQRFGEARQVSGCSVSDVYSAIGKYYSAASEQTVLDLESGVGKISAYSTAVPGAEQYDITYAKRLRAMADLFGCSVDFLLGRTDVKEMAQLQEGSPRSVAEKEPQKFIPGNWYPASVEPPVGTEIILIDRWNFVDQSVYLGSGQFSEKTTSPWCDIVLWSPMPKEATSTELPSPPAEGWLPLMWLSGREHPHKPLRAVAKFSVQPNSPGVEATVNWTGSRWEFKNGTPVDLECVSWFPLPSDEDPKASPLNDSCKPGASPSGHCGAAVYCEEPVDCCMNCDKDCNSRCGHMEG